MNPAIPALATVAGAAIAWGGAILSTRQRRLEEVEEVTERAKTAAATALVRRMSEGLQAMHGMGPAEVPVRPAEQRLWELPSDELKVTADDSPHPRGA